MSRKLASIQKILDIQPIPGADAIVVATINSWRVVVKKDEFKIGDLVVYFEVDSWIPHSLAPFLSKGQEPRIYEGVAGERLKTVRLRGQLSQGLVLPVSMLSPGYSFINENEEAIAEGDDVTEFLGVLKYDPPVPASLAGTVKGSWPSAIPKTDEERIQNLTSDWEELRQHTYEATEKLEGSSMTVGRLDSDFIVCSRNLNLKETEGNTLWTLARRYDIEQTMIAAGLDNLIIQGEAIGEGIQGNHYGIKGQDFYVYSMYDVVAGRYLNPNERSNICHGLGLKHVPIIAHRANLLDTLGLTTIDQVLLFSDGKSQINPNKLREGVVYKQVDGQAHWKSVSNSYLLATGN